MRALPGHAVVTPGLAEQPRVLPHGQRHHDCAQSCSKHGMLVFPQGKGCASQKWHRSQEIRPLIKDSRPSNRGHAGFRWSEPEIPQCGSPLNRPFDYFLRPYIEGSSETVPNGTHPTSATSPVMEVFARWLTGNAPPEGVASGVMKGLGLRCEDMNRSTLAGTAQIQTTTLSIGGMSCGGCVHHLTSALEGLTGVVHVEVDLKRNQAAVEHWPDQAGGKKLIAAIEVAGYTARVETTSDGEFNVSESTAAGRSTGCCCR